MRNGSTALRSLLQEPGAISARLTADVVRGSTRLLKDIPIEDWSFESSLTSKVRSGGSLTIAYVGDFGESVTPRELTDALAPYGSELHPYLIVAVGGLTERVSLGKYRIDGIPSASDSHVMHAQQWISRGSLVEVRLLDRTSTLDRTKFRSLESPPSLTSAYAEMVRISGMPITRSVPDQAIPADYVHPRGRLDAVAKLAGILGGVPFMRDDGTLTVLSSTPGQSVIDLVLGDRGTLLEAEYSMESEGVVNAVFGDFEDEDGNPIHVEAQITAGPLAVTGPYGEIADEYSGDDGDLLRTQAAAQAAVDADLVRRSQTGSYEMPITCQLNPLIEIGDVVTVKTKTRSITGWVRKTSIQRGSTMSLTLGVLTDERI